jgi:uncharacterized membrane protein YccC
MASVEKVVRMRLSNRTTRRFAGILAAMVAHFGVVFLAPDNHLTWLLVCCPLAYFAAWIAVRRKLAETTE